MVYRNKNVSTYPKPIIIEMFVRYLWMLNILFCVVTFKQPSVFRKKTMSTICNYRGMRNSKRKSEFVSHSDLRYSYFLQKYSICRVVHRSVSESSSRRMSKVITRKNTSMFQKFKSYLLGALRLFVPETN